MKSSSAARPTVGSELVVDTLKWVIVGVATGDGSGAPSGPVPRFLRGFAARDAYQAHLEKFANPLLQKATQWYRMCLTTSSRLGIYSRWTRICELEASRLTPDKIPLLGELRRQTLHRGIRVQRVPFILE